MTKIIDNVFTLMGHIQVVSVTIFQFLLVLVLHHLSKYSGNPHRSPKTKLKDISSAKKTGQISSTLTKKVKGK